MTKEQQELRTAWRTLLKVLEDSGCDFMYQNEIDKVAKVIRKELGIE